MTLAIYVPFFHRHGARYTTMDGESPAWLEGGDAKKATATSAAPSSLMSEDDAAPTASAAARTGLDNASASTFLSTTTTPKENKLFSKFGGKKKAADAATTPTAAPLSTSQVLAGEADLPKLILFMRLVNMAAAALLITTSILQLVGLPHISVWVTAIYATCGGLLICCLETQLKILRRVIAMNFGFLFHSIYRMLFYILMASVCWSYKSTLGRATAIVLGVVAVFNTYVLCMYPGYRKLREDIAAEEDARIQAQINSQVRKQAISSMGWGK